MGNSPEGLREAAIKSHQGAPIYLRLVNRPLGFQMARAFMCLGWSPNQVTLISAALTASGIVSLLAASSTWLGAFVGVVLLLIGFALDSADGQLARMTGRGSLYGAWLDHVVDAAKIPAIQITALMILMNYFPQDGWARVVPSLFIVISVVIYVGGQLMPKTLRQPAGGRLSAVAPQASLLRSFFLLPTDYGILVLAFLVAPAMNWFACVYCALFACNAAYLALLTTHWGRALRAHDALEATCSEGKPSS